MEERVKMLEERVNTLAILCVNQQDTISKLINCMEDVNKVLVSSDKVDRHLFTYCKELRKEVEKLKAREA